MTSVEEVLAQKKKDLAVAQAVVAGLAAEIRVLEDAVAIATGRPTRGPNTTRHGIPKTQLILRALAENGPGTRQDMAAAIRRAGEEVKNVDRISSLLAHLERHGQVTKVPGTNKWKLVE